MKRLWIMALTLPVAGCVSAESAICDGTAAARTAHAAALAADGGDLSVATGARLIRLMDAGCGND
jgi:hypothetical protein